MAAESDYALLDCGGERKLERFGPVILDRPAPQALWRSLRPRSEWQAAHARYVRSTTGGGHWESLRPTPKEWQIELGGLRLRLSGTGFGHLGVFPEQVFLWPWIRAQCGGDCRVLNLFAYTGGSTLAAALGGAHVTHCDASRGIIEWAQENSRLCGIAEDRVRWLVDDARKFVRRERRREQRYHGIILDPPSFGRGKKGEVFKLERDLPELLSDCAALLDPKARFLLLSAHTPGVGPRALRELLRDGIAERSGQFAHGELWIEAAQGNRVLPSGSWAVWYRGELPPPEPPR